MKNNATILTDAEIKYLKDKYEIKVNDDMILVKAKCYNRITYHHINDTIFLRTEDKRYSIQSDTVKMWKENFENDYSLVETQNAINILITLYQQPNVDEVLSQLKRKHSEIVTV